MLKLRRPSPALVVATAAGVIATGGVAFSAPSGPDGTIHACYNAEAYANGGSTMIVVPSADVCSRPGSDYPDAFTFNVTGPAGAAGAQGAPGMPGVPGVPGPKGTDGEKAKALQPKDVKTLQKELKGSVAAEKKLEREYEQFKEVVQEGDLQREQQKALDEMIKRIIAMVKQMQDQQAEQTRLLIRP